MALLKDASPLDASPPGKMWRRLDQNASPLGSNRRHFTPFYSIWIRCLTFSTFKAGLLENGLMDFQLEGGFWYLRVKGYKIVLRARSPRKLHSRDIFKNFFPGLPRAECSMNDFVALEKWVRVYLSLKALSPMVFAWDQFLLLKKNGAGRFAQPSPPIFDLSQIFDDFSNLILR